MDRCRVRGEREDRRGERSEEREHSGAARGSGMTAPSAGHIIYGYNMDSEHT